MTYKTEDSKFEEYFQLQHGECPSKKSWHTLREEMQTALMRAQKAEMLFKELDQWQSMRLSALRAWKIKDSEK